MITPLPIRVFASITPARDALSGSIAARPREQDRLIDRIGDRFRLAGANARDLFHMVDIGRESPITGGILLIPLMLAGVLATSNGPLFREAFMRPLWGP